jgi:hypothetical protein
MLFYSYFKTLVGKEVCVSVVVSRGFVLHSVHLCVWGGGGGHKCGVRGAAGTLVGRRNPLLTAHGLLSTLLLTGAANTASQSAAVDR